MPKPLLLPTLPPYVNRQDPQIIAWRQDLQETAIEHLNLTKIDTPNASLLKAGLLLLTWCLGLFGLASPEFVARVLKLLLT